MTKRKTSWRKVEEQICGRLKNNSRLIDADKLIQAFEVEEKQTNDEIRVGDEVRGKSEKERGVVIECIDQTNFVVLCIDGIARHSYINEFSKTGHHFDQIEEVLEQMRENDND